MHEMLKQVQHDIFNCRQITIKGNTVILNTKISSTQEYEVVKVQFRIYKRWSGHPEFISGSRRVDSADYSGHHYPLQLKLYLGRKLNSIEKLRKSFKVSISF